MKVLLAAPVLLLLAAVARAEDCAGCADGKVCLSHEAGDDIAIKALDVQLKSKDMMGKRGAIKDVAEAQMKHMNVRSKKITMALARALGDQDVDVKMLAADKLCEVGDPATAVMGLGQQITYYKKQVGNTKPKKAADLAAWENNLKLLSAMYESLARLSKEPSASTIFEADVVDSSCWIGKAAADACVTFKESKGLVRALYDAMKRWLGPSTRAPVPEGYPEVFHAMSHAMAAIVQNAPKIDGKNQNEAMAAWETWWKANESKYPKEGK